MKPRGYQIDAVEATLDCLWHEPGESPIVAMPGGSGKSGTIAWTCRAVVQRIPTARIIVSTSVQELVEQDARAMQRIWPAAPFGVYSAGLNSKQADRQITFASIQSMVKNLAAFGRINVLMIDEAQDLSPAEESNYQKAIDHFRRLNPKMVVVGYTATPFRTKGGLLTNGNIFSKFCYDITSLDDFVKLIDDGYLCHLIPKDTDFKFDVSKVHITGGDFNKGELQEAVNKEALTLRAMQEAMQIFEKRKHIIVFCAGIDHVESVHNLLLSWGEKSVYLHSKANDLRKPAIEAFKSGKARWIINDKVLTTGTDFPFLDGICLLRPTNSPGLHVQILSRGTRVYYGNGVTHLRGNMLYDQWGNCLDTVEGRLASIKMSEKQNCLVADFAGNVARLGPINDPKVPGKRKGKKTGEIPVKICPKCSTYNHAAARFCTGENLDGTPCTHEFIFETKIDTTAATTEVVTRNAPQLHWFAVNSIKYEQVIKPYKAPMMRVKYLCGAGQKFTEMVCIEHTNYAGTAAKRWWRKRMPATWKRPPPTTEEGLKHVDKLMQPTHIFVDMNADWPKVTAVSFDGTTPAYGKGN